MTEANKIFKDYMSGKENIDCIVYGSVDNRQVVHSRGNVSTNGNIVTIQDSSSSQFINFPLHAADSIRMPVSNSKNLEIKMDNIVILLMKTN